MKFRQLFALLTVLSLSSCAHMKLLKSDDYELKWSKANEYYEQGKYRKAIELLEDMKPVYKGTDRAEQAIYMLANAYYRSGDYYSATSQYQLYYKTYPKGNFAEDCRFMSGKAAYVNSPDARLSQEGTITAMDELNVFLEYYPQSERREEVEFMLSELMEKLAYKALLNSQLYYNLGNFMGNNYESCIITASNALVDFPSSRYRHEFAFLILESRWEYAKMSVDEQKAERLRSVVDEYYSFTQEYPESSHLKEAARIFESCNKLLTSK